MTTLTAMKTRIAQEVRRKAYDDVESLMQTAIDNAITTAIEAYQDERFYFNERRSSTLTTVADQEFYDEDDDADIGLIIKIDYLTVDVNGNTYELIADFPASIESSSTATISSGLPGWYLYYNRQLRFYPTPNDAYTIRIAGVYKYAAPASGSEADNFWMTDAERLIRSRAKYELALHVLRDTELAQTMATATTEALDQMRRRTNKVTQRDNGRVRPMCF